MRCGRCGGSMMAATIGDPGNYREGWKCICCGNEEEQKAEGSRQKAETQKGADMAKIELTEEQREAERKYQRNWWKKNKDEVIAKRSGTPAAGQPGDCRRHPGVAAAIGKAGRNLGLCQDCLIVRAMDGGKASAKKSKKTERRFLPERLPTAAPLTPTLSPKGRGEKGGVPAVIEDKGALFPAGGLVAEAMQEVRVELVYILKSAQIIRSRP